MRKVPMRDRFWTKVRKTDGCWLWTGSRSGGYGNIGGDTRVTLKSHRVAWELTYGPIPDGLKVLHRCDNPPCVRPDHLFLGTDADNAADRDAKGRAAPHGGIKNGRAKISEFDVAAIRYFRALGAKPRHLARAYGLDVTQIWRVATGRHWAA